MTNRRTLRVAEFIAATGMNDQTAREQLREGRLRGKKLKGRWRVYAGEVERVNQNRGR